MIIQYDNQTIRKRCGKAKGKLRQRLDDIHAARTMADLEEIEVVSIIEVIDYHAE